MRTSSGATAVFDRDLAESGFCGRDLGDLGDGSLCFFVGDFDESFSGAVDGVTSSTGLCDAAGGCCWVDVLELS